MQWLKNDKIKHQVVGLAVLLSFAIVFIPAMVKKSNQQLDRKMHLALNLPPKPNFPKVEAVKPTVLLETVKVAHVVIPSVTEQQDRVEIARAEPLRKDVSPNNSSPVIVSAAKQSSDLPPKPAKKVNLSAELKKELFSVQLASFAQQTNAETLVQQLHKQGYKASYDKQGGQYRVLVGQLDELGKAKNLQKQLATDTQMKGFIVKAG